MKKVITKRSSVSFHVKFGIRPNGANRQTETEQIPFEALLDYSVVNPDGTDVPEYIMEKCIDSDVIALQGVLRAEVEADGRSYEDKCEALRKMTVREVTVERAVREVGAATKKRRDLERKDRELQDLLRRGKGVFKPDDIVAIAGIPADKWAEEVPAWEAKIVNKK